MNTALNSMVFAWAFLVQWALGAVINLWPVTAAGYDPRGYRLGFGVCARDRAVHVGLDAGAGAAHGQALGRLSDRLRQV